jgi:hypothetical protein
LQRTFNLAPSNAAHFSFAARLAALAKARECARREMSIATFRLSVKAPRGRGGHPKLGGQAGTAIASENLSVKNSLMMELSARE